MEEVKEDTLVELTIQFKVLGGKDIEEVILNHLSNHLNNHFCIGGEECFGVEVKKRRDVKKPKPQPEVKHKDGSSGGRIVFKMPTYETSSFIFADTPTPKKG